MATSPCHTLPPKVDLFLPRAPTPCCHTGRLTALLAAFAGTRCKPKGKDQDEECTKAGVGKVFACFSADATVNVLAKGLEVRAGDVAAGDEVECIDAASGGLAFDRIIFAHAHSDALPMHSPFGGGGLSAEHRVPLIPANKCSYGGWDPPLR